MEDDDGKASADAQAVREAILAHGNQLAANLVHLKRFVSSEIDKAENATRFAKTAAIARLSLPF